MHYETKAVRDKIKKEERGGISIDKEPLESLVMIKGYGTNFTPHKKGVKKRRNVKKCKLTYCLIVH